MWNDFFLPDKVSVVARLVQRFPFKKTNWLVQGIFTTSQSKLARVNLRFVLSEMPQNKKFDFGSIFLFEVGLL